MEGTAVQYAPKCPDVGMKFQVFYKLGCMFQIDPFVSAAAPLFIVQYGFAPSWFSGYAVSYHMNTADSCRQQATDRIDSVLPVTRAVFLQQLQPVYRVLRCTTPSVWFPC